MEELVLNNRRLKLVDGEIWSWVDYKYNPCWRKVGNSVDSKGYNCFSLMDNKIQKVYRIHRVIYKFNNPDWDMTYTYENENEIDHIDNNRNNNNIENLRILNRSQNSQNKLTTKGYTWCKKHQQYKSQIKINKKNYHLGYYDTIDEAREAYLIGKEKYHTH